MKAKKIYESLDDVLKPKKLSFDEFNKWLDKIAMMTMHWVRQDKVDKDIYDKIIKDGYEGGKAPREVANELVTELNRLAELRREIKLKNRRKRKTNEGVSDILKPKSTEEIAGNLDFVTSKDDLYQDHEYIILDAGMNRWMNALHYDGITDDSWGKKVHRFVSSYANDDMFIDFSEEELLDSIENLEIAIDNTGMFDIL